MGRDKTGSETTGRDNTGQVRIRRRKRAVCPMKTYDDLPCELRAWVAQATLPWSPQSCRRIWFRARKDGLSTGEAVARLDAVERAMLEKCGVGAKG